ncbi:14192_t:CDS:2 [Ambispora leptoticha]|uniref:14192_t:CDS:1 n=1 Tax=Ambispora leptoticha TaxID=144679 RepID=A0A9N9BXT4_9GLOM|nr:14192_t:CDS:2 [Ambispora leptoticha]
MTMITEAEVGGKVWQLDTTRLSSQIYPPSGEINNFPFSYDNPNFHQVLMIQTSQS